MGFETTTMQRVLGMLLHPNSEEAFKERPGSPRAKKRDEPEHPLGLYGGTINHWGIALLALLVWARKKSPGMVGLILPEIHKFLDFQLTTAFMCRGRASELLSPTHLRQHLQYVLGFLLVAEREGFEPLQSDCILWLRGLLALCRKFLVPVSSLKGSHPGAFALVAPGFRGAPMNGHPRQGARDSQTERLCGFLLHGRPLHLGGDPMQAVDDASLLFLQMLSPATLQKLQPEESDRMPPLKTPLVVQRHGSDFVAALADKGGQSPPIQRFAGVIDGELIFGFDDEVPPTIPAGQLRTFTGSNLKAP